MLEEIVRGSQGFASVYALVNVVGYLKSIQNSMIYSPPGLDLSIEDHMKIGIEIFRYNFGRIQLVATALAAPPLLYNLYQLTQQ